MFKKVLSASIVLAAITFSANASAQMYAGVTVGSSNWNLDCSGATTCDKSGSAFRLLGGYDLSPNVALEAGYFSVGKAKASGSLLGYTGGVEMGGTGIDFSGVFKTTPAGGFSGFAKLGLGYVRGKTDAIVGTVAGSHSESSVQPVVGFGALYEVSKDVSLRAEIESRQVKLVDGDGGKGRVANFSVGVQVGF